jgi:hypothetical protein
VGAFIPFAMSCMMGLVTGLIYKSNLAEDINPIFNPAFLASSMVLILSILLTLAEVTLTYEVLISQSNLLIIVSRFNIKKIKKKISTRNILSIRKNIAKSTIGDTGATKVNWPEIRIYQASDSYAIPVTLNDQEVDEIVKMVQDYVEELKR